MVIRKSAQAVAFILAAALQMFSGAGAQNALQPGTIPGGGTGGGLPSLSANAQLDLQEDRQLAAQARNEYQSYGQQVQQYIAQLQERVAEAHIKRGEALARQAQLQHQVATLKGEARANAQQELAGVNSWLEQEKNMSAQAARNVQYCQQWLHSKRSEVLNAEYNASEDQQAIADAQRKDAELASQQRWYQQLAAGSAYYQQMNGYGYGGYGYGPRGHYHNYGYGYGHYGHVYSGHASGGHSGGSAHSAHAGGHR